MKHRLGLALATTVALSAAPQIALACSGDACSSVSAGTWSNGKVTITDKDSERKDFGQGLLQGHQNLHDPWEIKPGSNSVALAIPLGSSGAEKHHG